MRSNELNSELPEKKSHLIDRWIKALLLGRPSDGFPLYQENFLRQGIKEFPFKESNLFKMLVATFSKNQSYGEGEPAYACINRAFNGKLGFKDKEDCATCGSENAEKTCSNCKDQECVCVLL